MSANSGDERYLGSVRFYKHVILTVVGLLIIIPVCVCIILGLKNYELYEDYEIAVKKLSDAENQLAKANQSPEETEDIEETLKFSDTAWNLVLVNETHPIEKEYEIDLVEISGGKLVDARIEKPLNDMLSAMRKEGLNPVVCSGYRTTEKQASLFEDFIREKRQSGWTYEEAFFKAKTRVALPGTSEHHTGLAVDIVAKSHQGLDDGQADTAENKWLVKHCAEYGFILRYPEQKIEVTGIDYESWHFRYVGEEAAAYITENHLTLEEFLEEISDK